MIGNGGNYATGNGGGMIEEEEVDLLIDTNRVAGRPEDEEADTTLGHVNQYDFLEELGSGAQGTVFRSVSRTDGTITAIKVMEHGGSGRFERNPSALNEIAIMKLLDHPNLVNLIDVIQDRQTHTLNIVMEYVHGGPIIEDDELVEGTAKKMPEHEVKNYFRQLVMGLEYLHHHGVLHRDIKPSNLLLNTTTGELKICDFGVSSLSSTTKSLKVLGEDDLIYGDECGTLAFRAPEAFHNDVAVGRTNGNRIIHGRAADIWAAGCTLYTLLSGRLPFGKADSSAAEIEEEVVRHKTRFIEKLHVSQSCREVLLKCLEKDPAKRATVAWLKAHPWLGMKKKVKYHMTNAQKRPIEITPEQASGSVTFGRVVRKFGKRLTNGASRSANSLFRPSSSGCDGDGLDYGFFASIFGACSGNRSCF